MNNFDDNEDTPQEKPQGPQQPQRAGVQGPPKPEYQAPKSQYQRDPSLNDESFSSTNPSEYHAQAGKHMKAAHDAFMAIDKSKMPADRHHKVGLGVILGTLALAALDPTHQAGGSFFNSFENTANQRDAEGNRNAREDYQRKINSLKNEGSFQSNRADQLYQMGSNMSAAAQHKSEFDAEHQLKKDTLSETKRGHDLMEEDKKRKEDITVMSKDLAQFIKMADNTDPHISHVGKMGIRDFLNHRRTDIGDAGFDPSTLEELTKDMSLPTPKQAKMVADIRVKNATAGAIETSQEYKKAQTDRIKKLTPIEVQKQTETIKKIVSDTKVSQERAKKLVQDFQFAKDLHPLKVAQARLAIEKAHKALAKGSIGADDIKTLKAQNGVVKDGINSAYREMTNLQKVIKDNSILAAADDPGALDAIKEAKSQLKLVQGEYNSWRSEATAIANKIAKTNVVGAHSPAKPKAKTNPLDDTSWGIMKGFGG